MTYSVTITPSAKADIFETSAWLLENSPRTADKWMWNVSEAVTSLRKFPFRCPVAKEASAFDVEVRELLFGSRSHKYRILFSVREDRVFILRVRSTRQRPLDAEHDE